jgi:hypothetical protein
MHLLYSSATTYTTTRTEVSGGVGDIYLLYSTAATYITKQTDSTGEEFDDFRTGIATLPPSTPRLASRRWCHRVH